MDDMEVMQWFFDLESIAKSVNWHVDVAGVAANKRKLDAAIASAASASEVMDAYKSLAGSFGPDLMKNLLKSDDAFPEVNHSGEAIPPNGGKVLLYVDREGGSGWAEVVAEWGMPPKFEVRGC